MADTVRKGLRRRGWELRRTDPDRSLDEHLWFVFPYLGVNCVLDVGAGTGEYGAFLRQNGYTGHIFSFEPIEERFQILASRCELDPKWSAYQFAIGSENSTATINVMRNSGYSSFLRPTEHSQATFPGCAVERTEAVDVGRLDEVVPGLTERLAAPRLFLKTNVQGYDLEVLRGAERCLERVVGLHTELALHPIYKGAAGLAEAISAYEDAGFAVSGVFDRPHHHEFRLAELDCVMLRAPAQATGVIRRW
ncbi:MAG: FkbM family methyltransferase [Chloroflexota bacterium]